MDTHYLKRTNEPWNDSNGYELYVGRWSKLISADFVEWLSPQPNLKWLEIGCGTGALTNEIVSKGAPSYLLAIDRSEAYIEKARENIRFSNVSFLNTELSTLRLTDEFDHITSGLVLNFIPQIEQLLLSTMNNLKRGGQISAFVWDYAGHYQPMRHFWDAAKDIFDDAHKFDAGTTFSICTRENLVRLFERLNVSRIRFSNIERIATFRNFEDYWLPIASAQGSVAEFLSTLDPEEKNNLKTRLKHRLPIAFNGEIKLILSALGIEGTKM
jgi:trans-aconitate methyltransferase